MEESLPSQIALISGNEAIARGAYEAGLRIAASYPGTPATEILEYLSQFQEVDAQWSVNEKVAYEVALASSIAGVRSLYASKHVGLNVAMDPLMTSAYTGVEAGFVVVSCDDPGLHSSQNEQDSRLIAKMAKIPLLEPSSPAEAKEFVKVAFQVSEQFDTPVMVRLTTRVSHAKENVVIEERKEIGTRSFSVDTKKYVMLPQNAHIRHIELEKRIVELQKYSEHTFLNRIELKDKKIGFITSSVSYLYAKEMYPKASFLKLGFSYPLPINKVKEFARRVQEVFLVEELEPFLEEQLTMLGLKFKTRHPSFRIGELRPEFIPQIVNGKGKTEHFEDTKRPVMCPGCPHRPVFWVLKKVKAIVTGDIGCYTLGALPPLSSLHTCLCMGSGISFFEGFRRVLNKRVVGIIGDSTFMHSGIPALINAVYNKTIGLVIILDNGTTAMTGCQPHPATGITIKGEETKRLQLEDICHSCGADSIDVLDPHNIKELEKFIRKRLDENQLSVIIARAPCRLIVKKKAPLPEYHKEQCVKCHLCLSIDCPALFKSEDDFIEIHSSQCTGCNLCVEVCTAKAMKKYE